MLGGTMIVKIDRKLVTKNPTGIVHDVIANLPGCRPGGSPSGGDIPWLVIDCGDHRPHLDWVYYDFTRDSCSSESSTVELLEATSTDYWVLMELCRNLFPTTFSVSASFGCAIESVSQEVCQDFAVHARTTVTFDGVTSTVHGGDVGVSPGTSITGSFNFEDGGERKEDSSDFAESVLSAYAAAMEVRSDEKAMAIEIGGKTFTPGTYRSGSAINFAYGTVVTLDGNNEANPKFLFIAGSTLVTAADTYFNLINGTKAENVLWAIGTAATLGANSVLEGSILAGTAITFGTKSILHGCALAQSAVTFESEGSVILNH
jgi:hypothetical protein